MLQIARFSFACFLASFFLVSCKNDPKTPAATQQAKRDTIVMAPVSKEGAVNFIVTEGTVNWAGKKSIGTGHEGTINVEKGTLLVNNKTIISGSFTLDMNSIAVSDVQDVGERRDLESHLKDSDFFEADKFPKAEFVIKEVLPGSEPAFNALIVGNLTMKGKTNSVNIPVQLTVEGDELKAQSVTFPINRTQWGVNFRSGILGTTRDKLIDDNVLLTIMLKAKKG